MLDISAPKSPQAVFVLERGIQPWEEDILLPATTPLVSLIILGRACAPFISLSNALFDAMGRFFRTVIRWYTTGCPFADLVFNRLQVRRFPDEMSIPPPGFADTYLAMAGPDVIPCTASYLVPPITQQHLDALSSYRHILLVLSPDANLSPKEVCARLRPYDKGLNRNALESICSKNPDWVVARAYNDGEDDCAWQFYGFKHSIEEIARTLRVLGVKELRDRDELALWLQT